MLSAFQWCNLVISACSKTFVGKRISENRMRIQWWNSCLDFITKEIGSLNLSQSNSLDYYVYENIRGQSQVPSKTEDIAKLKEMLQMTV